jgi:hypothetical protein
MMNLRVKKSLTDGYGPWLVQGEGRGYDGVYWRTLSQHRTEVLAKKALERIERRATDSRTKGE